MTALRKSAARLTISAPSPALRGNQPDTAEAARQANPIPAAHTRQSSNDTAPVVSASSTMSPVGLATYSPCPDCEGTGFFSTGAFHPDDPRCEATWDCDSCDGTGEVDDGSHCDCGEPLDDNFWCASCREYSDIIGIDARPIGGGVFRVEL